MLDLKNNNFSTKVSISSTLWECHNIQNLWNNRWQRETKVSFNLKWSSSPTPHHQRNKVWKTQGFRWKSRIIKAPCSNIKAVKLLNTQTWNELNISDILMIKYSLVHIRILLLHDC